MRPHRVRRSHAVIIDFQQHYTPPEFLKGEHSAVSVQLDESGNPNYLLNPLLADLAAHVRMMDRGGIDAGVLSCGIGFDQPDLATCRLVNDRIKQAVVDHPGRFIGLAHVPALNPSEAAAELKRCAVELGFPGVVIASELQGQALEVEALRPFWRAAADLGLYVFVHPLARVIAWPQLYVDDLGRMLGVPARLNGAVPKKPFDHYLQERLFYDCAGWAGPDHAGEWGAEWVRFGLQEVALSQTVFATDYPQAVRDAEEVADYVASVRALGPDARAMVEGVSAERLIPDLKERIGKRA